jgi:hypothetical protein
MFDIERAIQQWREAQAAALGSRPEVVDELEGHLREELRRLMAAGQPAERAWETALARLGAPQQLAAEFAKVPPGPSWLPAKLALFLPAAVGVLAAWAIVAKGIQPLLASHVFAVTVGYTTTFAVGALAVWAIFTRVLSGWDERRALALRATAWKLTLGGLVLTALGVLLGSWWASDHLGRWWGWDLVEVGGLSVLVWYCVALACLLWGPTGGKVEMLLGLVGNVVVGLSWFGPALARGHGYDSLTPMAILLFGFVLAQVLILGIVFVPAGRWARQRAA